MATSAKELGRSRLDASLVSPPLSHRAGLIQIVLDQLRSSPVLDKHYHAWTKETIDKAAEKRAAEISTFLDALRSARQEVLDSEEKTSFSWKIKEETDLMRVMYRPGPEGAPYHTYCVEGIVNGPMVNAVCVAWEAPSFGTWWPQFTVPTFKVDISKWVKRIRVGEDLSHIRVKVPWPLAAREVLMTSFELEYFEDDIVIVLLGTAPSDPDEVEEEIYGFAVDELPPAAQNVVRMEVAGGFMLQKMTDDQSFFRTVVNMDIKLDIVPPWVINFITRQLVGSGYKLYQKAVLSASRPIGSGKVFQQLLSSEALYKRIKSGVMKSGQKSKSASQDKLTSQNLEQNRKIAAPVEVETESETPVINEAACSSKEKEMVERFKAAMSGRQEPVIQIDSEVERALEVLDRMIELVNDWKSSQGILDSPRLPAASSSVPVDSSRGVANGDDLAGSSSFVKPSSSSSSVSQNARNCGKLGCFGSGRRQISRQHNWPKLALLRSILWRRRKDH